MKKTIYQGKFKRFVEEDGWEFTERVNCDGIVAIFPVTDDGKLVFVEQMRVPVGRRVIEFPAGLARDKAGCEEEALEHAAQRELIEETGYSAETFTFVLKGPSSAASTSDVIHFYIAEGLKKVGPGGGDELESIRVHEVDFHSAEEWLKAKEKEGFLIDPKIYTGLYHLEKLKTKPRLR